MWKNIIDKFNEFWWTIPIIVVVVGVVLFFSGMAAFIGFAVYIFYDVLTRG